MAIGSAPEIGAFFRRWGEMNDDERQQWFDWLRSAPSIGTIVEVIREGGPS